MLSHPDSREPVKPQSTAAASIGFLFVGIAGEAGCIRQASGS
jgi:hypothetical protein